MTNKKQKILISVCAPIAVLGLTTAAVAGVLIAKDKKVDPVQPRYNTKQVRFYAGEGKFAIGAKTKVTTEVGNRLEQIEQPEVILPKGKVFRGWVDENGNPFVGTQTVKNDLVLKASLGDSSDEYALVQFVPYVQGVTGAQPNAKLKGNYSMSVLKHHHFYMVNRPQASYTDDQGRQWEFAGWRYSTNTVVKENDEITKNIVVVPTFSKSATITWNPNQGTIVSGNNKTTLTAGTAFNEWNQPTVTRAASESEKWYFKNWSYDQAGEQPVGNTDLISEDKELFAQWSNELKPSDQYTTLTFVAPEEPSEITEWTFSPTNTIIAPKGQVWSKVFKPQIYDANHAYQVSYFEYKDKNDQWIQLDDGTNLPEETTLQIRPVMEACIQEPVIYCENNYFLPESVTKFTCFVEGKSATTKIEWSVTDGHGEVPSSTVASINASTGELTIESLDEEMDLLVYCTATEGTTVKRSSEYRVYVNKPYTMSKDIWFHKTEGTTKKWYYIKREDLCNQGSTITYYDLKRNTATTQSKSEAFTEKLIVGEDASMINDNFAYKWTGFAGEVILNNVRYIGNNFMYGCTNFNPTEDAKQEALTLDNILEFGDNFLAYSGYNREVWIYRATYVGNDFMAGCKNFNSYIHLPETQDAIIMGQFLFGCTSFNKDIYLPATISYFGDFFMHNCNAFTSVVNLGSGFDLSRIMGSTYCFSSNDSTSDIATTGFTVASYDSEPEWIIMNFCNKYPNMTASSGIAFRKLTNIASGDVTQAEFETAAYKLVNATNLYLSTVTGNCTTTSGESVWEADIDWTDSDAFESFEVADGSPVNTLATHWVDSGSWDIAFGDAPAFASYVSDESGNYRFNEFYNFWENVAYLNIKNQISTSLSSFPKLEEYGFVKTSKFGDLRCVEWTEKEGECRRIFAIRFNANKHIEAIASVEGHLDQSTGNYKNEINVMEISYDFTPSEIPQSIIEAKPQQLTETTSGSGIYELVLENYNLPSMVKDNRFDTFTVSLPKTATATKYMMYVTHDGMKVPLVARDMVDAYPKMMSSTSVGGVAEDMFYNFTAMTEYEYVIETSNDTSLGEKVLALPIETVESLPAGTVTIHIEPFDTTKYSAYYDFSLMDLNSETYVYTGPAIDIPSSAGTRVGGWNSNKVYMDKAATKGNAFHVYNLQNPKAKFDPANVGFHVGDNTYTLEELMKSDPIQAELSTSTEGDNTIYHVLLLPGFFTAHSEASEIQVYINWIYS